MKQLKIHPVHKYHNSLLFHHIHEAVASKYVGFHFLPSVDNPAYVLSKQWYYALDWRNLQCLLFWKGDTSTIVEKGIIEEKGCYIYVVDLHIWNYKMLLKHHIKLRSDRIF